MILGLGIDLEETARIRESIEKFGERFLEKMFTPAKSPSAAAKPMKPNASPRVSPPKKPPSKRSRAIGNSASAGRILKSSRCRTARRSYCFMASLRS